MYIYLLPPFDVIVTVHVTYGKEMPHFRCESKLTCRPIFALEIYYLAQLP